MLLYSHEIFQAEDKTNSNISFEELTENPSEAYIFSYFLIQLMMDEEYLTNFNIFGGPVAIERRKQMVAGLLSFFEDKLNSFDPAQCKDNRSWHLKLICIILIHSIDPITRIYWPKNLEEFLMNTEHNKFAPDTVIDFSKYKIQENFSFADIPQKELWRLYIDADAQRKVSERGWVNWELREPNSIRQMHRAFQYALKKIDEPVSSRLINEIHKIALNKVEYVNPKLGGGSYGMSSFSLAATIDQYLKGKDNQFGSFTFRKHPPKLAKNVYSNQNNVEELIDVYNKGMDTATTDNEKVLLIVTLCSALTKNHIFADGNARTHEVILLNRELIKHGLYPCILDDPNNLDGLVYPENCMVLIEKGMLNFISLMQNGHILNISEEVKTPNVIKKFQSDDDFVKLPELEPFTKSHDLAFVSVHSMFKIKNPDESSKTNHKNSIHESNNSRLDPK